jgi:hypothetical protein
MTPLQPQADYDPEWHDRVYHLIIDLVETPDWGEKQRIVWDNREDVLSAMADSILANLAAEHLEDELARKAFEAHRKLLSLCRALGVKAAFDRVGSPGPQGPKASVSNEQAELISLLTEFLNAETLEHSKRIVLLHEDELLSEDVDPLLDMMRARHALQPDRTRVIATNQKLLQRCREIGVEAAYEEVRQGGT